MSDGNANTLRAHDAQRHDFAYHRSGDTLVFAYDGVVFAHVNIDTGAVTHVNAAVDISDAYQRGYDDGYKRGQYDAHGDLLAAIEYSRDNLPGSAEYSAAPVAEPDPAPVAEPDPAPVEPTGSGRKTVPAVGDRYPYDVPDDHPYANLDARTAHTHVDNDPASGNRYFHHDRATFHVTACGKGHTHSNSGWSFDLRDPVVDPAVRRLAWGAPILPPIASPVAPEDTVDARGGATPSSNGQPADAGAASGT